MTGFWKINQFEYFKGFLAIHGTELTVKFVDASQCFVSAINISAVKCDKAVGFPKSSHICLK